MKHLFIALWLPVLLAGCSTYSKKQCLEMDWFREGKSSALNGFTPKQAKTPFIDKCQEDHKVPVDFVEFDRGFAVGLQKLCSPEGIRQLKDKGVKYQETCEAHYDALNLQKSRKSDVEERIQELEEEVARLKAENAKLTEELNARK